MCWFYFVPNLLIIYQLDTLYLGGNYVNIVCKRVWRNSTMCAFGGFSRLDLASDLWLATRQNATRMKHVGSWRVMIARALQDKNDSLASYLSRAGTRNWDESRGQVARMPCFSENWLFTFLTYATINILIPTKCKELLEIILREKP